MLRLVHHTARRANNLARSGRRLASTQTPYEHRDIVIVGGGPVGLALSSALSASKVVRDSLSVELIEAGPLAKVREWNPEPQSFSNRAVSLTNASQQFLEDIGAWGFVEEARTCPIEEMQVWDGLTDARITFSAMDHLGEPQMSRLTENLNLQRALLQHLSGSPVHLTDKTKVAQIVSEDNWPLVHLDNGRVIRARLLIGADGPNSPVRHYAQIPTYGWGYDTQAIVATLNHTEPLFHPNTTAFQRFLPTGPIAFLPLAPNVSSLVWSTKPELAKIILASPPEVLSVMINAAFRLPDVSMKYLHQVLLDGRVEELKEEIMFRERSHGIPAYSSCIPPEGGFQGIPPDGAELLPPLVTSVQPGTAASFPLRYNHTETYIGATGRTALVGDAAHSVHPLAGQGLNLGLADVQALAKCIEESVSVGGDIGSLTSLEPYPRARYLANHTVMSAVDKLHKLYNPGSRFSPIVWARSMGLEVVNEMDSLKSGFMKFAGGSRHESSFLGNVNVELALKTLGAVTSGVQAARIVKGTVDKVFRRK